MSISGIEGIGGLGGFQPLQPPKVPTLPNLEVGPGGGVPSIQGPSKPGGPDFGGMVLDGLDRLDGVQRTADNLAVQAATGDRRSRPAARRSAGSGTRLPPVTMRA